MTGGNKSALIVLKFRLGVGVFVRKVSLGESEKNDKIILLLVLVKMAVLL